MRKLYLVVVLAVLCAEFATAQPVSTPRRLYWKANSPINTAYEIASATQFVDPNDWYIKNTSGTFTAISTLGAGFNTVTAADTLFIEHRRLKVAATMTLGSNVRIIMLGEAPDVYDYAQTFDIKAGVTFTMSNPTAIFSIGGDAVFRLQERLGADIAANYTRLVMGGVTKAINTSNVDNVQQKGNGGVDEGIGSVAFATNTWEMGAVGNNFGGFQRLGALPATLTVFTATKQQSKVAVTWTTQQESNLKAYIVERSNDTKTWTEVSAIAVNGNSTTPKSYSIVDPFPAPGVNYYRLRMIDVDATYSISPIRAVRMSLESKVGIYPNPASGTVTILVNSLANTSFNVSVFNTAGQLVQLKQGISGTNVVRLNVSSLKPGTYWVQIRQANGEKQLEKLIVQ
ncbi:MULTISPECIES: T9SS type A sorting domain-containing protein [unclassified Paraflavitalea]|uniref:T9SS type A sorting domain-containing protein n=1 Tax=unclassified Paraflavitalea TaxID=2798305 RepID=UPI003D353624